MLFEEVAQVANKNGQQQHGPEFASRESESVAILSCRSYRES